MSGPSERQVTVKYANIMAVQIPAVSEPFSIKLFPADSQVPQGLRNQAARTGGTNVCAHT